ncbi:MAG TPA: phosphatase PAP2 family protein [Candidatus Paceibacterota bacterium]|nr:phosphatase PAP2 family protein [Candidatus Paceibacterota bacterium]
MDAIAIFIAKYLYLFVLAALAIFFFLRPRKAWKDMVICGVIVAPLAYVLAKIGSLLYADPRPFVVGHFIPLIAHAADNGFPSDHVLLAGAVAMVVWFFNKKLSAVLWIMALLIGWARVYSGIHHPADIAGSIAFVLIAGAIYALAMKKYRKSSAT